MKRKNLAILSILLALTLLTSACGAASKLTEYDFGADKIPSVNVVIGAERKVTGVSTGTSNGTQYKKYTYETDSVTQDLMSYLPSMMDSGWIPINDFNLNDSSGKAQLAIESADAGKIIVLTATFESGKYEISLEKFTGTLTPK